MAVTITVLDYDTVHAEITALVAAKPDHIYENPDGDSRCCYVHDTADGLEPGCLIGLWLHQTRGVPLAELRDREGGRTGVVLDALSYDELLPPVTDKVRLFLDAVQEHQDSHYPWQAALAFGEAMVAGS